MAGRRSLPRPVGNSTARALAWVLLTLACTAFGTPVSAQGNIAPGEYRLGAGDVIQVQVYGEEDLSMELPVTEQGRVDYAFVGQFELLGKTVAEVKNELHQRLLGDYLIDPQVSVTVARYRDFYIRGEVARTGGFQWEPGMTVRKALTLAGGLRERASRSKWFLLPEGSSENDRRRVSEDDLIGPGDTLTVEQSFF